MNFNKFKIISSSIRIQILFVFLSCFCVSQANAWFFFFIPNLGSLVGTPTSNKANFCASQNAKVGATDKSPAGHTLKLINIFGTSATCSNPTQPISAQVEYTFNPSKAGINLSDDWEVGSTSDWERYGGEIIRAKSKSTTNKTLFINTFLRQPSIDLNKISNDTIKRLLSSMKNPTIVNSEELKIIGLNATRVEVSGETRETFSSKLTTLLTIIEGKNEYILISLGANKDDFGNFREEFKKFPDSISGLEGQTNSLE